MNKKLNKNNNKNAVLSEESIKFLYEYLNTTSPTGFERKVKKMAFIYKTFY